jgi:hypothetical protein
MLGVAAHACNLSYLKVEKRIIFILQPRKSSPKTLSEKQTKNKWTGDHVASSRALA